jgi:dCTP diphosphatase
MRQFSEARDWGAPPRPQVAALALAGEVGEVAELVQWLPADTAPDEHLRERLGDELADVLLYLSRLADVAGIDLGEAALTKLARNEERFSVAAYRSVAPERRRPSPAPWTRRRPANLHAAFARRSGDLRGVEDVGR